MTMLLRSVDERAVRAQLDAGRERSGSRYAGIVAALGWVLGDAGTAPLSARSGEATPEAVAREYGYVDDVLMGRRGLPVGADHGYVVGVENAVLWAQGRTAVRPVEVDEVVLRPDAVVAEAHAEAVGLLAGSVTDAEVHEAAAVVAALGWVLGQEAQAPVTGAPAAGRPTPDQVAEESLRIGTLVGHPDAPRSRLESSRDRVYLEAADGALMWALGWRDGRPI